MAAKKSEKKVVKASCPDPAEDLVRQMPALRRDDAAAWLCRSVGFDPTLLESAIVRGWVALNYETGLYAGQKPAAPSDPEGEGVGPGVGGAGVTGTPPTASGSIPAAGVPAAPAVPESVPLDLFSSAAGVV